MERHVPLLPAGLSRRAGLTATLRPVLLEQARLPLPGRAAEVGSSNLFTPHGLVTWRHYGRKGAAKHWSGHPGWSARSTAGLRRMQALFSTHGQRHNRSMAWRLPCSRVHHA